jgi:hypothetical protein
VETKVYLVWNSGYYEDKGYFDEIKAATRVAVIVSRAGPAGVVATYRCYDIE